MGALGYMSLVSHNDLAPFVTIGKKTPCIFFSSTLPNGSPSGSL